jgi:hypothetical protein
MNGSGVGRAYVYDGCLEDPDGVCNEGSEYFGEHRVDTGKHTEECA